ncbi:MAG: homoserine dehydrogenase [Acidimicrobiia bacterium]|nr:homoserine dehydrogenase [Acidimicrobiia bacterium]MDH3469895.1 homoserine dehydrogenase [Acidimicrobiia bacterium]
MSEVGIGILGAGTVGGPVIKRLINDHDALEAKTGLSLTIHKIGVRDAAKQRDVEIPEGLLTTDLNEVVSHPDVQLVVEVMGGTDPAGEMVLGALRAGKPVVTANKELVASKGPELIAAAEQAGVPLLFEAAVGGGIPIIRPLSETLAGEPINRVLGIVNGTTNFILSRMADAGQSYEEALAEAQQMGFAEPDPSADVSGADAASKACILASLAFGTWIPVSSVYREGIERITQVDIDFAEDLGYVVKLLAVGQRTEAGISVRVHPAMVRIDHPLAAIRGATNAIFIEGPSVGELLFAGPGAGGEPTATAVLGDVIDAAREILAGAQVSPRVRLAPGDVLDFGEVATKWYIRLDVADEPGVLAQIASAFGTAEVSIKSVWQEGQGDEATLLVVTHSAAEAKQRKAVESLEGFDVVRRVQSIIRVESDEV